MLRLLVLDRNGHSTITTDIEREFRRLVDQGYAAFVNDLQTTTLPTTGDVLMVAPLAGG